mgnify:CR=1 FL=1
MEPLTLDAIQTAIRQCWDIETCDPDDVPVWVPTTASRGQCIATALVVHDIFGGELLEAKVHDNGVHRGYHTWNRLPGGIDVDLTRDQFLENEVVGEPEVVPGISGPGMRVASQYAVLRARLDAKLHELAHG